MTLGADEPPRKRPPTPGGDPAFLSDPRLHKLIANILARKVRKNVVKDARQDVLERLVIWCRSTGAEDEKSISAGATGIVKNVAKKWWRDEVRHARIVVGSTDAADDYAHEARPDALDPIDVKRTLAELNLGEGPANDKARAVIIGLAEEASYEEIAEKTGQSVVAVRKSAERERKKLASRLVRVGRHEIGLSKLLAAAGMLIVLLLVLPSSNRLVIQDKVAYLVHGPRQFEYTPQDWSTPRTPEMNEEEIAKLMEDQAASHRELMKGEAALKSEDWGACEAHANAAARHDPSGTRLAAECKDGFERSMAAKGPGGHRKP